MFDIHFAVFFAPNLLVHISSKFYFISKRFRTTLEISSAVLTTPFYLVKLKSTNHANLYSVFDLNRENKVHYIQDTVVPDF